MASSLYTLSLGLTNLLLPPTGGAIYDLFGGNVSGREDPLQEKEV